MNAIEQAASDIIELNVEARCGWEQAASEVVEQMTKDRKLKSADLKVCAARFLAREAQEEHRRSFQVAAADTTVPQVEELLKPVIDKLMDPLMRMVDGMPFAEHDAESITRWWEGRHAFANGVRSKHQAETRLKERTIELLDKEGVEIPAELSAASRFELAPLAQRALVD